MSEKLVSNILMSTREFGHDITFKWRLRNLSFLKLRTDPIVKHDFSLHPKCDTRWSIIVKSVDGGYKVIVGTQSSKVPKVVPPSPYIGLVNPKGELVLPYSQADKPKGDNVCMEMEIRLGAGNTVIIGDDKVVELENDTLVMMGRLVVPICCIRTEIDKEETTVVLKTTEPHDIRELIKDGFVVA